ncbi:hypothetical protein OSTOST_21888 [Ostertagia ostertagi]
MSAIIALNEYDKYKERNVNCLVFFSAKQKTLSCSLDTDIDDNDPTILLLLVSTRQIWKGLLNKEELQSVFLNNLRGEVRICRLKP